MSQSPAAAANEDLKIESSGWIARRILCDPGALYLLRCGRNTRWH
jgi:hypothetical protein